MSINGRTGRTKMNKVIVYTSPMCYMCNTLKTFLKDKKVSFDEVDLSKDTDKAKEIVAKSGSMSLPQMEINGKILVGFDIDKINEELSKCGAESADK